MHALRKTGRQRIMYDYHHLPHEKKQIRSKRALWITLALTLLFGVVEAVGGWLSGSLALLSDAAHMGSDVVALGLGMLAIYLAAWPPNARYTFGYLRFEVIAALLNGLMLVVLAGGIFVEGARRFYRPEPVDYPLMLAVALIGLAVNLALTIVLSRSMRQEKNLNIQSALWHFFGDLLSSIGVILSAVLIRATGLTWFDPLISVVIGTIIAVGGVRIVREAYWILMESVPAKFDLDDVRADLARVEGVEDVHETHLWSISANHFSLTAHVFARENVPPHRIVSAVNDLLRTKYGIVHSTVQVENAAIHEHGEYGAAFLRSHGGPETGKQA